MRKSAITSALMVTLGCVAGHVSAHPGTSDGKRLFKPISAQHSLAVAHEADQQRQDIAPPTADRQKQLSSVHLVNELSHSSLMADASAQCALQQLADASSATIAEQVTSQGVDCVNALFSASNEVAGQIVTDGKMLAVADRALVLASNYNGQGSADLEALFLFLRAGFYVEFYNDQVSLSPAATEATQQALDAFVANTHFYANSDAHGKTLSEVIITMDSAELQHRYLPQVKQWLSRWDQSYGNSWHMRSAVNGIFTILFRGQWNDEFMALAKTDTELARLLGEFTAQTWMIGSDSEYLITNAARELARLKMHSGEPIEDEADKQLSALFARYNMVGYGDALWLGAADIVDYYGACAQFEVCGFKEQVEQQVLGQIHQCSDTIRIRAQQLSASQQQAACEKMAYEEGVFHDKLATNNQPVADDLNSFLQVNVFNSSDDYKKYAGVIFGIDTNNGGMYLEGDPSNPDNQANFVAYEASYANAEHYVWNLEHEYVHYLDGRFNLYGDFNAPTADIVWWSEGVAEYVSLLEDNSAAIETIKDGSTYQLGEVFATTYAGFDQDRIYRWGYLGVRFMFERHRSELANMLANTRQGNWQGYQSQMNSWAASYGNEFTTWTQALAGGENNTAPTARINALDTGVVNQSVAFDGSASSDNEGAIASYLWDFGDGTSGRGAIAQHSYNQPGSYIVTLSVSDEQGLSHSISHSITIEADSSGGITELSNGQSVSISGAQDSEQVFRITLPQGTSALDVTLSGGSGDADLYVREQQAPTTGEFDCRPYIGGNEEQCQLNLGSATSEVYIMVRGYNAFADVSLTASYQAPSHIDDMCAQQGPRTDGRLVAGETICLGAQAPMWFSIENVAAAQSVRIETAHGSGDLMLEYANQGWPNGSNVEARSDTSGNVECLSVSGQSNYWGYLKVSGNSAGASLKLSIDEGHCQ